MQAQKSFLNFSISAQALNNAIESYHGSLGALSGIGKNTLSKTCSILKMYKERNMLSIENGAFIARNKRTVEKHASQIALRNGDIMSPDPSNCFS